jgi:hypothetical protein
MSCFCQRIASILSQAFHPTAQNEWWRPREDHHHFQWWCIHVESVLECQCCRLPFVMFEFHCGWTTLCDVWTLNLMIHDWMWRLVTDYDD